MLWRAKRQISSDLEPHVPSFFSFLSMERYCWQYWECHGNYSDSTRTTGVEMTDFAKSCHSQPALHICKVHVGAAVYSMLPQHSSQVLSNNCVDVLSCLLKISKFPVYYRIQRPCSRIVFIFCPWQKKKVFIISPTHLVTSCGNSLYHALFFLFRKEATREIHLLPGREIHCMLEPVSQVDQYLMLSWLLQSPLWRRDDDCYLHLTNSKNEIKIYKKICHVT